MAIMVAMPNMVGTATNIRALEAVIMAVGKMHHTILVTNQQPKHALTVRQT